jgi:hypothetical protein
MRFFHFLSPSIDMKFVKEPDQVNFSFKRLRPWMKSVQSNGSNPYWGYGSKLFEVSVPL